MNKNNYKITEREECIKKNMKLQLTYATETFRNVRGSKDLSFAIASILLSVFLDPLLEDTRKYLAARLVSLSVLCKPTSVRGQSN